MKRTVVNIVLPPQLKATLQQLADEDQRPLSSLIRKVLVEYVQSVKKSDGLGNKIVRKVLDK